MKIRVLQSFAGLDIVGIPGQELEVSEKKAQNLIRAGYAEPAEQPKKTPTRKRKTADKE